MMKNLPISIRKKFLIPVNPVIHGTLRAIFAGGPKSRWQADSYGRPVYRYETGSGILSFYSAPPPDFSSRCHPSLAMYYTPRLGFIYSGSQREAIRNLSVETADVFIILMGRISLLKDPGKDITHIALDDIARMRNVRIRHGSKQRLHEDFKKDILRLADLRVTMEWRNYRRGGIVIVGKDRPDRLLDILDITCRNKSEVWTAFRFRCGQSLSHFLNPQGLRWIGYYQRSLLHLNPYREALTKKIGTYWIMVGTVAEKKGFFPRATPRTILDFCGEDINWRNPGETVDAFISAHERLVDIGVLEQIPILEPLTRIKGYYREWLNTALTVKLSEDLWRLHDPHGKSPRRPFLSNRRKVAAGTGSEPSLPCDYEKLQKDPSALRRFRSRHHMHQDELARAIGITRQTLSCYERGLRAIPEKKSLKILELMARLGTDVEN